MKAAIIGAVVITVAVGLLGFATPAIAFCVYNDADVPTKFQQVVPFGVPRSFNSQWLAPGKNACCHWSNKDCNTHPIYTDRAGDQRAILKMSVAVQLPAEGPRGTVPELRCGNFNFEAGGYLKAAKEPARIAARETATTEREPHFGTSVVNRGITSRASSSIEWRQAFGFSE